ncbi:MAG: hypothetical protein JO104_11945 [Candidatus Eremiobacteraeota bacterium]|nr:hypothetical protein [Candidatus Eremiobacteraeota bacterium]
MTYGQGEPLQPLIYREALLMANLPRFALTIGAAALIAGCGAPQPPMAAPGAMPQLRPIASRASTPGYRVVYQFQRSAQGDFAAAPLLDVSGKLYGTTKYGGADYLGVVYRVSTGGVERVLHSFAGGSDGQEPAAGLLNVNGMLYGTTTHAGSGGCGTVYSISKRGDEKVLYGFRGSEHGFDGCDPEAPLIEVGGTLYGTTYSGGHSGGTVFSVTTKGVEKVLYRFSRHNGEGRNPYGGLVEVKGMLYGTTEFGGGGCRGSGCGTVYRISKTGEEKVLYKFRAGSSDGAFPIGGLVNVDDTLYGTTNEGGSDACNKSCGTVYSITTHGREKVLYYFNRSDGARPHAGLIDVNDTLYGTTELGGTGSDCLFGRNSHCGTVFSLSISGMEQVLHSFAGGSDGGNPVASLIDVNGTLYGTTALEGGRGGGISTVFAVSP